MVPVQPTVSQPHAKHAGFHFSLHDIERQERPAVPKSLVRVLLSCTKKSNLLPPSCRIDQSWPKPVFDAFARCWPREWRDDHAGDEGVKGGWLGQRCAESLPSPEVKSSGPWPVSTKPGRRRSAESLLRGARIQQARTALTGKLWWRPDSSRRRSIPPASSCLTRSMPTCKCLWCRKVGCGQT